MVGELVAQRLLDLAGEQLAVVAEVAFERVAVDHDPVLEAIPRDAVAEVLAVGAALRAELGDDDRHALQHPLEFLRQGVDRVGDQGFELVRWGLIHCSVIKPLANGGTKMKDDQPTWPRSKRVLVPLLAILAVAASGVLLSACGDEGSSGVQQSIEEGVEKAKEGITEGAEELEKGAEEAKEKIEEGKESATEGVEKGVEEAEKGIEEGKQQAEEGVEKGKEEAEKFTP